MMRGVGRSDRCEYFGIADMPHAKLYLQHASLFANYSTVCAIVHRQLVHKQAEVQVLMGGEVDASSATLFSAAADELLAEAAAAGAAEYEYGEAGERDLGNTGAGAGAANPEHAAAGTEPLPARRRLQLAVTPVAKLAILRQVLEEILGAVGCGRCAVTIALLSRQGVRVG